MARQVRWYHPIWRADDLDDLEIQHHTTDNESFFARQAVGIHTRMLPMPRLPHA